MRDFAHIMSMLCLVGMIATAILLPERHNYVIIWGVLALYNYITYAIKTLKP